MVNKNKLKTLIEHMAMGCF